jgi:hypothetical protein
MNGMDILHFIQMKIFKKKMADPFEIGMLSLLDSFLFSDISLIVQSYCFSYSNIILQIRCPPTLWGIVELPLWHFSLRTRSRTLVSAQAEIVTVDTDAIIMEELYACCIASILSQSWIHDLQLLVTAHYPNRSEWGLKIRYIRDTGNITKDIWVAIAKTLFALATRKSQFGIEKLWIT